jgi:hypothetical protein
MPPESRLRSRSAGGRGKRFAVITERRPYHLYPLLGLVLVAAMAIGLYFRIKYPPKR